MDIGRRETDKENFSFPLASPCDASSFLEILAAVQRESVLALERERAADNARWCCCLLLLQRALSVCV